MARLTNSPIRQYRGTDAQHKQYTGPSGELTINTTYGRIVLQDGQHAGGIPHMRYDDEPVGTIKLFAKDCVPSGWAQCNGGTISGAIASTAFAAFGSSFGASTATSVTVPSLTAPVTNTVYAIKVG